jgi:hypothetical protein
MTAGRIAKGAESGGCSSLDSTAALLTVVAGSQVGRKSDLCSDEAIAVRASGGGQVSGDL